MASDPNSSMKTVNAVCKEKFKQLVLHTKDGIAKDLLNSMGIQGYTGMVKNMIKVGQIQTADFWPEDMRSVAEATSRAAIQAREEYGDR